MKTYLPKITDIQKNRKWFLIDATDNALGRIATKAAFILQGKHKADFVNHLDCGDCIVIINAEKVKLTGNKANDKLYYRHSGQLGNLKKIPAQRYLDEQPTKLLEFAIQGMLPKNKHRKNRMLRLKVVAGSKHNHEAQKPEILTI